MVYDELSYLANTSQRISSTPGLSIGATFVNQGVIHPLWSILNSTFPPELSWRALGPKVRMHVIRAGYFLHENDIPYGFYASFLKRFRKGHLKRKPMTILIHTVRKDGSYQVLLEFVKVFLFAKECFYENPDIIRINDRLYSMFPDTYDKGSLSFMHSLTVIRAAMKNHSVKDLLSILAAAKDASDFWNGVGQSVVKYAPAEINLDEGTSNKASLNLLQQEMRVRLGRVDGKPNAVFDRYFKKNGTLNAMGLKVVSGEKDM